MVTTIVQLMKHWRMAMRVGTNGPSMWPVCFQHSLAAITYEQISRTDFSDMSEADFANVSRSLKPTQKASLRRIVFEMKGGDIIYVKEGNKIVAKGIVRGPEKRAYRFGLAKIYDRKLPVNHDTH